MNILCAAYARVILGLGNVEYGSRRVADAVRRGIQRLEFIHALLIGVFIVSVIRAYLRYKFGIDVQKNHAVVLGLLVFVVHLPIMKILGACAVRYQYRHRSSLEKRKRLRLISLGLYFGSPIIALLLVLIAAYLIV